MKKFSFILFALSLVIITAVSPLAESSDVSTTSVQSSVDSVNTGYPAWQIAVVYCIMFTVISVIGVMFIKTVKKNKHI